jgi:hypothetical protein
VRAKISATCRDGKRLPRKFSAQTVQTPPILSQKQADKSAQGTHGDKPSKHRFNLSMTNGSAKFPVSFALYVNALFAVIKIYR